jgi:RsiW-degrading membrane proteinase PrsW (M82 family)
MKEDNTVIHSKQKRKYKWSKILKIGFVTYIFGLIVFILTQNPNIFPSLVILGNFLIPVTYVSFFYEKRVMSKIRMSDILMAFFYGGFLGTFAASILEPIFIYKLDFKSSMMVGVIEEFAKIIGVLLISRKNCNNRAMDGIILGASAGMGFAALESSGYAFTAFLHTGGSLSSTVYITLLRGIMSPLGHGTWTAILAGALVSECRFKKVKIGRNVIGAYLTVVLLHGLWDGIPSVMIRFTPYAVTYLIADIFVGFISILILYIMWKRAKLQALEAEEGSQF